MFTGFPAVLKSSSWISNLPDLSNPTSLPVGVVGDAGRRQGGVEDAVLVVGRDDHRSPDALGRQRWRDLVQVRSRRIGWGERPEFIECAHDVAAAGVVGVVAADVLEHLDPSRIADATPGQAVVLHAQALPQRVVEQDLRPQRSRQTAPPLWSGPGWSGSCCPATHQSCHRSRSATSVRSRRRAPSCQPATTGGQGGQVRASG